MRYQLIANTLFQKNRSNFAALMETNCIAILCSNDVQHTNADDVMGFAQNADLFYLSGIDQEETVLLLYPDAYKNEQKEILFIKKTDENIKIWEGDKLSKEEAGRVSGIGRVEWLDDFEKTLNYSVHSDSSHRTQDDPYQSHH